MRIKSQRDFIMALLFVAAGLWCALGALDQPLGSAQQMGPGYVPLALSVLLVLLGTVLGFNAMTIERDGGDRMSPMAWRALFGVLAALLGFAWLVPHLGMVATVPLVVLLAGVVGARAPWRASCVLAVLLALLSYGALALWPVPGLPVWPVA